MEFLEVKGTKTTWNVHFKDRKNLLRGGPRLSGCITTSKRILGVSRESTGNEKQKKTQKKLISRESYISEVKKYRDKVKIAQSS